MRKKGKNKKVAPLFIYQLSGVGWETVKNSMTYDAGATEAQFFYPLGKVSISSSAFFFHSSLSRSLISYPSFFSPGFFTSLNYRLSRARKLKFTHFPTSPRAFYLHFQAVRKKKRSEEQNLRFTKEFWILEGQLSSSLCREGMREREIKFTNFLFFGRRACVSERRGKFYLCKPRSQRLWNIFDERAFHQLAAFAAF